VSPKALNVLTSLAAAAAVAAVFWAHRAPATLVDDPVDASPVPAGTASRDVDGDVDGELAALRLSIADLSAIVGDLGDELNRLRETATVAAAHAYETPAPPDRAQLNEPDVLPNLPVATTSPVSGPYDPAAAQTREIEQTWQLVAGLEARMMSEDDDPGWAPSAEDGILATLQSPDFQGSNVGGIDCQTNLCRMEVEHADMDAELQFLHGVMTASGFSDAEAFYTRDEANDGSIRMTFYMSRPGQPLLSP
jgi:hypothetical protein